MAPPAMSATLAPFVPLPRRAHFVDVVKWAGADWLIGVGLDHRGIAVEVFVDPCDTEVAVDHEVLHFAHSSFITASHLLQHGVRAKTHADRLRAQSPDLLVLALDTAVAIEEEAGDVVRQLHPLIERAFRRETVTP